MYCESCGKNIIQNLNYCNGCGKPLTGAGSLNAANVRGLIWSVPLAVGVITLGGFGMLLYFRLELSSSNPPNSLRTTALMLAIFLSVLVIDWILLRHLSKYLSISQPSKTIAQTNSSGVTGDVTGKLSPPIVNGESIHITDQATRLLKMPDEDVKLL